MMVFNAPPKLLQDIAAVVGVQVAIADTDEQEARWIAEWLSPAPSDAVAHEIDSFLMLADLGAHSHLTIKVMPHTYNFRHGGTHPLSDVLTAYTWCSGCGEILSLDNDEARKAMELDTKPSAATDEDEDWQDEEDNDGRAIYLSEYGDR